MKTGYHQSMAYVIYFDNKGHLMKIIAINYLLMQQMYMSTYSVGFCCRHWGYSVKEERQASAQMGDSSYMGTPERV